MEKLLTRLGLGLGAVALIVAILQAGTISDLETRLDELASKEPVEVTAEPTATTASYDDSDLTARIAALETKLADERTISKAVERAAVSRRPRTVAPRTAEAKTGEVADEVNSLRADVDALLTGAGVQGPEAKKQITDLVSKLRKQERAERTARWTEFRKKADAEFVASFAEEAGLSEEQTQGVTTILSGHREARMKLRQSMREGTLSFEDMRAQRRTLREKTNQQLGGILDEKQLEDFTTKMQERRRGRRGGL